jgi:hypothetical protein
MTHLLAVLEDPASTAVTVARTAPAEDVVLGALLLAVLLVSSLWFVVGHAITIAHEGGHALGAILVGSRVTGVRLNRDRTGLTQSGITTWLASLPFLAVGYVAPSLFGLAGAFVLARGRADVVLWASIALLGLLLTATRNLFGWVSIVVTGLLLYLAAVKASPGLEALAACTWVWLLLVGGLVHIVQHGRRGADHAALRKKTWIPALLWAFLFTFVALAAIVAAVSLLLGGLDAPTR